MSALVSIKFRGEDVDVDTNNDVTEWHKLAERHRAMEASNVPPYESEPVQLNTGELTMICTALQLLEVVRKATK